jgi:hypothetical protein
MNNKAGLVISEMDHQSCVQRLPRNPGMEVRVDSYKQKSNT